MTAFETLLFKGTDFSRMLVIFKPYLYSFVWRVTCAADDSLVAQPKRAPLEQSISLNNQRHALCHTVRRRAQPNYIKNTPLPELCLSNN
jgi:hypothetical protein